MTGPSGADWLRYAEEDLAAARAVIDAGLPPRIACFHAQQAAEKAMKAVLTHLGIAFRKMHELEEFARLAPRDTAICQTGVDLKRLSQWAVESRYPNGVLADDEDARDAVDDAAKLVEAAVGDLET